MLHNYFFFCSIDMPELCLTVLFFKPDLNLALLTVKTFFLKKKHRREKICFPAFRHQYKSAGFGPCIGTLRGNPHSKWKLRFASS